MRKISMNLLAFVMALFTSQGLIAQNVLFEEAFDWGQGNFKVEGYSSDSGNIWQWMFMYHGIKCDASGIISEPIETRYVSPEITLENNNVASFSSTASNFVDVANEIGLSVREVGGEWTDLNLPVTDNSGEDVIQDVTIPEKFNGKKVEVAFRYTSQGSDVSGLWIVKNLVVKGGAGGSEPVEKVDPALSFDVTEVTYKMGDVFTAPILNNPNNVVVSYTSSNDNVASINSLGYITINGEGVTTIKAFSSETDKYLAGEASYQLTVIKTGGGGGGGDAAVVNLLEATFDNGTDGFTVEGDNGVDNNVWTWRMGAQDIYADGYGKMASGQTSLVNRMVSPEITLGTNNVVTFSSSTSWFSGDLSDNLAFSIREVGGEWVDLALKNSDGMGSYLSEEFEIPADYNGKKIQIGFKYSATSSYNTAMWYVDNVVVKGSKSGDTPSEKADPQISFNIGDVEAVLGEAFEAPVLNNPNNVAVTYKSNKPEVATVDIISGEVTLVSEGFATITATSVENDQYKSVSVNYVLTVKPASDKDIIFEEYFETSLGEFTVEGYNGEDMWNIWINTSGYAKADAYNKIQEETTNYLVSPAITLDAVGNKATFGYYFTNYDADNAISNQIGFCVREVGGEWEQLEMSQCSDGQVSCDVTIPSAYAGKTVQVGFKYTARSSILASIWNIEDIIIKKVAAPVEKKDPEISFDVDVIEYNYIGEESFVAPVLNNPNNVEVYYTSSNPMTAYVDTFGNITILGIGEAIITATSVETDEFKSGTASYTINVIDVPTGIEGITVDDLNNGKVYDLQGRRVNKLGKGVYIVNGKKVIIK